jgi:hypothetical protein
MSREEYDIKLKELEKEFNEKKTALIIECGLSQRKFNNGDIIRSNTGVTIEVSKVKVYTGFDRYPIPVYHGAELTKALVPKKNGDRGAIYGNDDVILIKEYKNGLQ